MRIPEGFDTLTPYLFVNHGGFQNDWLTMHISKNYIGTMNNDKSG
jgi:hypothetical protein